MLTTLQFKLKRKATALKSDFTFYKIKIKTKIKIKNLRSAKARLAINQFCTLLRLCSVATAEIIIIHYPLSLSKEKNLHHPKISLS